MFFTDTNLDFFCPPEGPPPPLSGECGTIKSYSWTTSGNGLVSFYVPGINRTLTSLTFTPISNNGSNITVEMVYYVNSVLTTGATWNFSTLPSIITKTHYLDFGNLTSTNATSLLTNKIFLNISLQFKNFILFINIRV